MEFPALVYKSDSDYVAVANEDELAAKLAEGYFETVPEALAPKKPAAPPASAAAAATTPAPTDDNAPATRDELKQKATELGLEFASNIPTDKLAALVAAKLAEGSE